MLEAILFIMGVVILVTIGMGVFSKKITVKENGKKQMGYALKINMAVMAVLVLAATLLIFSSGVSANNEDAEPVNDTVTTEKSNDAGMAYIAAALSTGLATIGAGIAVAVAGSAALGAISEDSSLLGKTLIFVGLAEGIAIYGLIISIMILNKV